MAASDSRSKNDPLVPKADEVTLAGVVHDVNQMLTVITGRAGLMLNQPDLGHSETHLRAIALAANDAAAMLRRLSQLTPAGQINDTRACLFEVGEESRLLIWPQDRDEFCWKNQLDPALRAAISPQLLREVLNNLLLNAVAAMPDGGQVTLSSKFSTSADKEQVILQVADNGPGLPSAEQEWVFGVGNSTHQGVGRGVGLASCRQLIVAAGGELIAASQSGGGTLFSLILPLAATQEHVSGEPEVTAPLPATILVVDDEASVREMLVDVFEAWGCRVEAYRDAETVANKYQSGTAQVALLDQNLPGCSGQELAEKLRREDSSLGVILASGWRGEAVLAADFPAVDFVADKPMALPRLRQLLQQAHGLALQREKGQ